MDLPVYTGDVKRRNKCIAPWWAVRIVSSDPTNTPGLRWCLFPSDLLQGVWGLIWTWFSANSAGFLFRWTKLLRADKEQRRPDTETTQNIRLTVKIRETTWRIIQNSPRDRPHVIQYIQPSHSSGRDTKQPTKEVVALSSCVIHSDSMSQPRVSSLTTRLGASRLEHLPPPPDRAGCTYDHSGAQTKCLLKATCD